MPKTLVIDLILPASVMLLKLIMKLIVDREFLSADLARAGVAFPVDIAFLSMAFGAAVLSSGTSGPAPTAKGIFLFVVGCVFLALLVTLCSSRAGKAMESNKIGYCLIWCVPAYFLSFLAAVGSVEARSLL